MKQYRLSLGLSAAALLVAVFGSTPLGHGATRFADAAIPKYARTAGYAKIAGNAALLNGHKAAASGAPGTVVVVGANGRLPASIGAVGPAGPAGSVGVSGYQRVTQSVDVSADIAGQGHAGASCPSGEKVLGGGGSILESNGAFIGPNNVIQASFPDSDSSWSVWYSFADNPDHDLHVTVYAICAKVD